MMGFGQTWSKLALTQASCGCSLINSCSSRLMLITALVATVKLQCQLFLDGRGNCRGRGKVEDIGERWWQFAMLVGEQHAKAADWSGSHKNTMCNVSICYNNVITASTNDTLIRLDDLMMGATLRGWRLMKLSWSCGSSFTIMSFC